MPVYRSSGFKPKRAPALFKAGKSQRARRGQVPDGYALFGLGPIPESDDKPLQSLRQVDSALGSACRINFWKTS